MSGPPARGWEAVEHADDRLRERAAARQHAEGRRRRRRSWTSWALRVLLPVLGAAAALAVVHGDIGDLHGWTQTVAGAALGACVAVPALVIGWLGRHDGVVAAVLWALVGAAAVLALVFGAGFGLLGLGPE